MKLTSRDIGKLTSLLISVICILGYAFFKKVYPNIKSIVENTFKVSILPNINGNVFLIIIIIIILINITIWLIIHKINRGVRYSLRHYLVERGIRKQLIYLDFDIKDTSRIVKLPKILIEFKDKKLLNCEIRIQNLVKFDKNIENLRLESSLKNYRLVTSQVLSDDGNWYVFKCRQEKAFNQLIFNNKEDYLKWSKADNYKYKISENEYISITHAAISGQTGSGKTYYLQSVLLQLISKEIPADIKIIDPKHADLYYFGLRCLDNKNLSDKANAVNLISDFYKEMQQRQEELSSFFKANPNTDYRDAKKQAKILIIDEFGSLRESFNNLAKKDRDNIDGMLSNIAFLGRQLGCFLRIATQQFNHKIIPTQLTEQMVTKIVLGNSDEMTYRNLFSQSVRILKKELKPGYGYFSYPGKANSEDPLLFVSPYCKFLGVSQA